MPDYYYNIKGQKRDEPTHYQKESGEPGDLYWKFPPLFAGMVTAPDKKAAKALIDEEYGRVFPQRVLRKDMENHPFLLSVEELDENDRYVRRRFEPTQCQQCGDVFRIIDKFNDPLSDYNGPDFCSRKCYDAGKDRRIQEFSLVSEGKVPPVIYQIMQISTGKSYVGQTTQPFTLRWWQHLVNPTDAKFHQELNARRDFTDWQFRVLEVIGRPPEGVRLAQHITHRERHWIDELDAVDNGFNTVRPTGVSPQQDLDLPTVA